MASVVMLRNALLKGRFLYAGQQAEVSGEELEALRSGGFVASEPEPAPARASAQDGRISARAKRKK